MARKSADRKSVLFLDLDKHGPQRTQSEAKARQKKRAKDKAAKNARKRNRA